MGFMDNILKRSFHVTQSQLEQLIKEYQNMGFQKQHITLAWQRCNKNQNNFHDTLIQISQEENDKVMSKDQFNTSFYLLKQSIRKKEEDDIKRAIYVILLFQQIQTQNFINLNSYNTQEDITGILKLSDQEQTGLKNIGNTCYMNVMLQAVYNVKEFRKLILDLEVDQKTEAKGAIMILRLQELFSIMMKGNRNYVNPTLFFESMAAFKPSIFIQLIKNHKDTMLVKGLQNDYYELWVSFLEAIEEGLTQVYKIDLQKEQDNLQDDEKDIQNQEIKETQNKQIPNTNPMMNKLKQIFYGRSEETFTYLAAENEIKKFTETSFGVINLDSKDGELYKAFRACQQLNIDEYISDEGFKTKAKIDVRILEPPKVLSFYINRVSFDSKQQKMYKNNNVFQFSQNININLFYKDPNQTTKYNKQIQERLDYLNQEEMDCLEDLKSYQLDSNEKTNEHFESLIKMLEKTSLSLNKSITIDDFQFYDQDSSIGSDMISNQEMIEQLKKYQRVYQKRQDLFSQKFENISQEKKKLMDDKQNIYNLTGVIIHDGTAESGHYLCFVLDQQNLKWIKCNDQSITYVDFEYVYKTATGQINSNMNVSGLVYQEKKWMESAQNYNLIISKNLEQYVQIQNQEILQKIDEANIDKLIGSTQMRINSITQRHQNKLMVNNNKKQRYTQEFLEFETFLFRQQRNLFNFSCMKEAVQIEIQSLMKQLNFPENKDLYEQLLLKKILRKYQIKEDLKQLEKDLSDIKSNYEILLYFLCCLPQFPKNQNQDKNLESDLKYVYGQLKLLNETLRNDSLNMILNDLVDKIN